MKKTMQQFLEDTRYENMDEPAQARGLPQPPLELPYAGEPSPLPAFDEYADKDIPLREALTLRRSVRAYASTPITQGELSYALWATQGIRVKRESATFRTVPSAGARHAFETLILVNQVAGLQPGLYRYVASEHGLVALDAPDDVSTRLEKACLGQKMVSDAAVTFFWFADIGRMTYRYGERGYRYIFLDAGHVSQNLYLVAEQLGLGTCAIGAFDDNALNAELGLDGEDLFTVYAAPLGKKKPA